MCLFDRDSDDEDFIYVDNVKRTIRVSNGRVSIGCTTVNWDDVEKVQRIINRYKASPVLPFAKELLRERARRGGPDV